MTQEQTIQSIKDRLKPLLAQIVQLMEAADNPLLVDIPEDASLLSEKEIAELIAKTNNAVNKAARLEGAAYAAYKMQEQLFDLTFKKSLDNEGKNEDQRKALAAQAAEEASESLRIAEGCYRFMASLFHAAEINSQSARKLVDNFATQLHAESREAKYGKTPDTPGRI
jgi:hypothetical protein